MKKILSLIISITVFITSFSIPVFADSNNLPVTLIVELEDNAVLDNSTAREIGSIAYNKTSEAKQTESRILSSQAKVQKAITSTINSDAKVGYTYTTLINGFSIEVKSSDIDYIKSIPGVKAVYEAGVSTIPTPIKSSEESYIENTESSLGIGCNDMNVAYMHNLGYKGQGQVICVVDTELDINHEMFAEEVENPRYTKEDIANIISSKPFNVSNITADRVYHSSKLPFVYNYFKETTDTYNNNDDFIHGSHVSAIATGKNGTNPDGSKFSGVAPEAQLVFMAVMNERGGIPNDMAIAALDDAAKLDVCAVNFSFGITFAEVHPAYEKAIKTATDAGIYVSVSAGNSGRGEKKVAYADEPCYNASGIPDSVSQSCSVASSNASYVWIIHNLINTDSNSVTIVNLNSEQFIALFDNNSYEFVDCGSATVEELKNLDLTNKIAVANRSFDANYKNVTMVNNITNKGALGVIIVNNDDSIPEGVNINLGSVSLPFAIVNKSDGDILRNTENKTIVSITKSPEQTPQTSGISSFSSWGVNSTLELKPEITAPGGMIYSAIPDNKYDSWNGTSMAAPHITGAVALIKPYIMDNFTEDEIGNSKIFTENLLMTSAKVLYQTSGIPFSPRNQGAGLADLEAAAKTPVILTGTENKTKISLKELDSNNYTLSFTAHNYSDNDVTYNTTLYAFTDDAIEKDGRYVVENSKELSFTTDLDDSITIPANDEITITANVTLDETELESNKEIFTNGFYVDGFVILTPQDSTNSEISIPYTGFYGDWANLSVFGERAFDDDNGFDRLTTYNEKCICSESEDTYCIDMGDNNVRTLLDKLGYADSYPIEEYKDEIFAGYSPNNDNVNDGMCVLIKPLRTMIDGTITITNSTGEEIFSDKLDIYDKYSESCYDYKEGTDGDYTLTIKGRPNVENSEFQYQSFSYYVDTQYPKIDNLSIITEDNKTYLDVDLKDNRYLMGAVLENITNNNENLTKEEALNLIRPLNVSEASVRFDITDIDTSDYVLQIYDYAGNITKTPISNISVEYIGSITGSTTLSTSFEVNNKSGNSIKGCAVITVYDKNSNPIDIKYINDITFDTGITPLSFNINKLNAKKTELVIWDSFESMHPLTNVANIDL
ncbi:MAG: S8 family serine peptidase [Lachnospirales bacterium]